jgi:Lamin Tail Domain
MKLKYIQLILVLAFAAGCNSTTTAPRSTDTPGTGSPSTSATNYPAPGGYPAQVATYDPYPASNPAPPTATSLANLPTNTPDPAQDPVIIAGFTHKDNLETVIIKNISSQEVNIGSWAMHASAFEGQDKFLPINLRLAPSQTYELYSGTTAGQPANQVWLKDFAFQQPGDEVDLLNPAGRIIFSFTYYP